MNLFQVLDATALRQSDAPAVYHGKDLILTYGALRDRALRLSQALANFGVGRRVAIATNNCPEYLEILFGTWAGGLTIIPINAKLHAKEIISILESSGAEILFCSQSIDQSLQKQNFSSDRQVIIGSAEYAKLIEGKKARFKPDFDGNDVAWIFHTSGTTGRPKGAMLTHENLLSMAVTFLAEVEAVHHSHSLVHAAPMSHGSGLYAVPYVLRGAANVIPKSGSFDPGEFLKLAGATSYSAAFLAPTMVQRVLTHMTEMGVGAENLRAVIYGGGPMHLPTLRRALQLLGPNLIQIYGQAEAPMTISVLRREEHITDQDGVLTSVGWPQAGIEVRIIDDHERDLPANTVGEIVCRGMVVMKGYLDDPKATSDTLRGGWLHTGDLGYRTNDGRLHISGRLKELIISGGSNVYPREVEDVILECNSISEVCVAGLHDQEWGEKLIAFIVKKNSAPLLKSDLDELCLRNLARFKRPREYFLVDALPKNSAGKVLRNDLLRQLEEGLETL